jgi:tRNA A37 threonylcarbamoyladenosine dehydratase
VFYLPETANEFDFTQYDYVVDAIDTVSGKIALVEQANKAKIPVISSMGAGNKLDPTAFEVADITKTSVCPLARVMRRELKKRGVEHVKVVYSREEPNRDGTEEKGGNGKPIPASISFVPPVAGLIMAGEVIKDLIK